MKKKTERTVKEPAKPGDNVTKAQAKMAVHYSSQRNDWETPTWLFEELDLEFDFQVDAACSSKNRLAPHGWEFDKGQDALVADWVNYTWPSGMVLEFPTIFVNPPYGHGVTGKWLKKGYEEAQNGATVVMLIPARTDTKAWHKYCMKASEVRLCKGRLVFHIDGKPVLDKDGRPMPAPFPSAVIVFDEKRAKPKWSTLHTLKPTKGR